MGLKLKRLNLDSPRAISKRLSESVADKTAERVHTNLKNKQVKY